MAQAQQATPEQLQAFAQALTESLAADPRNQEQIAHQLTETLGKVSQTTISNWKNAKHEPTRRQVRGLEELLGLAPGTLSRPLGYLPADALRPETVEDAIAADLTITPEQRANLLDQYRGMAARAAERRRQRTPRSEP